MSNTVEVKVGAEEVQAVFQNSLGQTVVPILSLVYPKDYFESGLSQQNIQEENEFLIEFFQAKLSSQDLIDSFEHLAPFVKKIELDRLVYLFNEVTVCHYYQHRKELHLLNTTFLEVLWGDGWFDSKTPQDYLSLHTRYVDVLENSKVDKHTSSMFLSLNQVVDLLFYTLAEWGELIGYEYKKTLNPFSNLFLKRVENLFEHSKLKFVISWDIGKIVKQHFFVFDHIAFCFNFDESEDKWTSNGYYQGENNPELVKFLTAVHLADKNLGKEEDQNL